MRRPRQIAGYAVISALGFYALAAQTLLFRDFFGSFESNEIAIGAFFSAWLGWICVGAFVGRLETRLHRRVSARLPLVALLYVPAFFLQQALIARARTMAGIESYDVFPLVRMLGMAFVVNAPVSFLTGFLFTLACRWADRHAEIPAARVYVLETLGSCAGGICVTLALAGGMAAESVSMWASLLLAGVAVAGHVQDGRAGTRPHLSGARPHLFRKARARRAAFFLVLMVCAVLGATFGGRWLADARVRAAWARLLPADEYRGAFTTAQGTYLYGEREGQFNVIAGGEVCESLPPGDRAAEVAAVHLAQRPGVRNALVIGQDGLGICLKLLQLAQVEHVAWHDPDTEYPGRLLALVPPEIRSRTERIQLLPSDPTLEPNGAGPFDLILLNLPEITTLGLNRYVTESYYAALQGLLTPGGTISVRVPGGANFMGNELALQGSSVFFTLGKVFSNVTIKPGDETWVMGSTEPFLYDPVGLRKRYELVEGAPALYPPENIPEMYSAGRVGFQMQAYRQQIERLDKDVLLNTETNPKALVYALLLAVKQAGLPSLGGLLTDQRNGTFCRAVGMVLVAAIALYGLLRGLYLAKSRRGGTDSTVDGHVLVFTTGMAGMALGVVLMFGYQSKFGSLFLDMGLVSALFMFGAFLGSGIAERCLIAAPARDRVFLAASLFAHVAVIGGVPYLVAWQFKPAWAAGFLACGLFTGVYFPIAARRLQSAGRRTAAAGSNLELLDNLGGAVGAGVTGIGLLPFLGLNWTALLLAALVGVNIVGAVVGGRGVEPASAGRFERLVRPVGYLLAGVGALVLFASQIISGAIRPPGTEGLGNVAQKLAGERPVQKLRTTLPAGEELSYFSVAGSGDKKAGYVFSSKPWAASVYGFAGLFELGIFVDETGALEGYEVVSSSETPMYLSMVRDRDGRLAGRNLFKPKPFEGIDAVVGATVTDETFRDAMALAGQGFACDVLQLQGEVGRHEGRQAGWRDLQEFLLLSVFAGCGLLLTFRPQAWLRRIVLAASAVLLGFMLNLQYSTEQVVALLTLQPGRIGANGPFFLLAVVPLVVLFFGNVHCGYVCPFGALQELSGDVGRGLGIGWQARRPGWKYSRVVKYLVLFSLVVVFGVRRDPDVLRADPLISFFGSRADRVVAGLAFGALVVSLFFGRFWCRNLCPSGAFLSLVNGARVHGLPMLRRLAPARLPGRCDLAVGGQDDMDCLCCDRCRDGRQHRAKADASRFAAWAFVVVAVAVAVAIIGYGMSESVPSPASGQRAAAVETLGGQPRDVDLKKVRKLLRDGILSDHPADYSVPVAPPAP